MLCSKCNKRQAIIFFSRIGEDGKKIDEGYCNVCANEIAKEQVNSIASKLAEKRTDENKEEVDVLLKQIEILNNSSHNDIITSINEGDIYKLIGNMTNSIAKLTSSCKDDEPPIVDMDLAFGLLGNLSSQSKGDEIEEETIMCEEDINNDSNETKEFPKWGKRKRDKKRKYLKTYGEDLTVKALEGKIDRVIGREKEIDRVIQILNRRTKNNPCLIGEPGVGKTAIAEGIALKIAAGDVPSRLIDKEIYLLNLTSLVAGTQFRGQFESRVKGLIEEVKLAGNIILFIDEVHSLVGTGDSEGTLSAANILKPALSRGDVQVIGATTFGEYRKYIEKDSALERRFQPVNIVEPTIDQTIDILMGIKDYYESYHNVKLSDSFIKDAVLLSERYITDRFLPDKAIDLIDEACSCAALSSKDLDEYLKSRKKILEDKEYLDRIQTESEIDFAEIAKLKAQILNEEINMMKLKKSVNNIEVTEEDIAKVIELWTGIPAFKVKETEIKKLSKLEDEIKEKIVGQDEAVNKLVLAVKRSGIKIRPNNRPSSFIFVGPTGVGKTELAKVLANQLFEGVDPLIRLDMSEYMEKFSVSKIIGSPPGYVGYDEAGQLTEKVRRKPYSVVLFDEIEKAHPDVMNILLQVLSDGKITDSHGRQVSFENTIIIMTSNAGSNQKELELGFNKKPEDLINEKSKKALSEFLRPEFLARVGEVITFRKLLEEDYEKITEITLKELKSDVWISKNIEVTYSDQVIKEIAKKAYNKKSGARDIQKIIRDEIEDRICSVIINNINKKIQKIHFDVCKNIIEYIVT